MRAISGIENSFEQYLADKASIQEFPIGVNLELTPVCNMDCKMCYVRKNMSEVSRLGGMPDKEMWITLGQELKKMSTLFVLITGGEPLLYPAFKEVYQYYHSLGFILTVNTNGTLLDEEWVEFFANYPPRRLNITIYGKDNKTYETLCGYPKGFEQFSRGVNLALEKNIPLRLNCSLTKYNYDQLEDFRQIAKQWDVPLEIAYYMFPPGRKITDSLFEGNSDNEIALRAHHNESRLKPETAAKAAWDILTEKMDDLDKKEYAETKLLCVKDFVSEKEYKPGYKCRAGNSSFWVKWDGSMTACGMMGDTEYNIQKGSLSELWEQLKQRTKQTELSRKCCNCHLKDLCPSCAAAEFTENGMFGKEPKYLCDFAEAFYQLLKMKEKEYEGIL